MNFISLQYALFFPVVCAIYFLLAPRYRWILLLASSCLFYMAFIPQYILVLFFLILVDYVAGLWIENTLGANRKRLLIVSIIANVGLLCLFKYFDFFNDNIQSFLSLFHISYVPPRLGWILPLGISFHTFQSLAYTIEVYRGNQKAERHLGIYALYVLFFPQLVAGPIERPQHLLPQFRAAHEFNYDRATSGCRLILLGYVKKIVIADRLGVYVDQVYGSLHTHGGFPLFLATLFFCIQIFCDFSGYTDIARGSARILGFELVENFKQPYLADSVGEFWHRWHISLSTWFRDYLYRPLAFDSAKPRAAQSSLRKNLARLLIFQVSGLWHGAKWTFVIWGLIHGVFLVISDFVPESLVPSGRFGKVLRIGFTFLIVTLAWVFFRADSLSDAFYVFAHMFDHTGWDLPDSELLLSATLSICALFVLQAWNRRSDLEAWLQQKNPILRWCVYYAGLILIAVLGTQHARQFIYFQF